MRVIPANNLNRVQTIDGRFAMERKICWSAALIIAVTACGGSGGGTAPTSPPGVNTPVPVGGVSVTNNAFAPDAKVIKVGDAVSWSWNSCDSDPYGGAASCVSHSVTFDDGTGSVLQNKGTYSRTFNTAGTYNYHCSNHGLAMSGTVTVQP